MVMEAIPTPDAVGREFVRQYYTLLNRAPSHAHRFYGSNSYFVHGAMSKPAIGQRQIHQKIQQLNFRDCHAKINQVDSQATLGNGLVVQVSGELSNDGEPMRRFTQTFVLGTHNPKMYYVHNDIFRYQDMLLSDEEGESPSREEDADQPQDVQPDVSKGQNTGNIQYFSTSTPGPVETLLTPNPAAGQNVSLNGTALPNDTLQAGQTSIVPPQEPAPVINGRVVAEDLNTVNDDFMLTSQTTGQPEMKSPKEKINRTAPNKPAEAEESVPNEQEQTPNETEGFSPVIQDLHISEVSNEPKTYANLLKMDRMVSSGLTSTSSTTVINRTTPIFNTASGGQQRGLDDGPQQPRPPRVPVRGGPTRGNNRKERSAGPSRSSFNEDGGTLMGSGATENQDRRRNPVQYSDNHQLFMGNLPLDATEDELRELFSKFGTIVDLRIHSKTSSGTKGPPGNRVPNYGFITFENPQSVQDVLNNKPICFPEDGGVKLNVEEKKTKVRSSLPPQGGGGGGGGGAGGGGGGGGGGGSNSSGGGGNTGGSESNWSSGRALLRGGPSSRGSRGGGARGNFSRDSRGPPPNQRSNFTPRR